MFFFYVRSDRPLGQRLLPAMILRFQPRAVRRGLFYISVPNLGFEGGVLEASLSGCGRRGGGSLMRKNAEFHLTSRRLRESLSRTYLFLDSLACVFRRPRTCLKER